MIASEQTPSRFSVVDGNLETCMGDCQLRHCDGFDQNHNPSPPRRNQTKKSTVPSCRSPSPYNSPSRAAEAEQVFDIAHPRLTAPRSRPTNNLLFPAPRYLPPIDALQILYKAWPRPRTIRKP